MKLPRVRKADAAMVLPTSAQVYGLLNVSHKDFRAFVALCSFAGLRLGETAALQVGDFDIAARKLTVSRQVQRAGAQGRDPRTQVRQ